MGLTAEQLQMRRTGVTATDATAIVGVNRFRDPVAVYLEKTADLDKPLENEEQKGLGNRLEPLILDLLAEDKALHMVPTGTERSAEHPWALATPDRMIIDPMQGLGEAGKGMVRVGVAEAKNVGLRMLADWRPDGDALADGEDFVVPDYVHVQVAWQMLVTGMRVGYVGVLLGGRDFRAFVIPWDAMLADTLLNVCGDFWHRCVLKGVPPAPGSNRRAAETIERMFPRNLAEPIDAPPEAEAWARQHIQARMQEKHFEGLRIQAENSLKLLTGSAAGLVSTTWRLSWKNTAGGGVDWKGLAEAVCNGKVPGDLVKKFQRPGNRRFLLTPAKKTAPMLTEAVDVTEGGGNPPELTE